VSEQEAAAGGAAGVKEVRTMIGATTGWFWGGCALMMLVMMVWMIPMMGRGHGHSGHTGHGWTDDPERTLADRLARGEIDTEEYERRLEALRHTDHPAHI
jgi:putative membrane protein